MTRAVEFDLHPYSRSVRRYHTRRSGDGGASGAAIHNASGARLLAHDDIVKRVSQRHSLSQFRHKIRHRLTFFPIPCVSVKMSIRSNVFGSARLLASFRESEEVKKCVPCLCSFVFLLFFFLLLIWWGDAETMCYTVAGMMGLSADRLHELPQWTVYTVT